MKGRSEVLKAANIKWLVMLVMLDAALVFLFIAPQLVETSKLAVLRASASPLLPVVVLLLTGLMSHELKAKLIYWRISNPLPGSRAFTELAPADDRIDMKSLEASVGALPTDPREQNATWYKLYRQVGDDAAVTHAQKLFLMYRDMAVMSLPLIPVVPAALWYAGVPSASLWASSGLFATQYLVCAIGARHAGARFVCNVLAIHSAAKVKAKGRAKAAQ